MQINFERKTTENCIKRALNNLYLKLYLKIYVAALPYLFKFYTILN